MSFNSVVIQTKPDIQCINFQKTHIWSDNGLNLFKLKEPLSSSRSNILLFVTVIFLSMVTRKAIWSKRALKSKNNFFLVLYRRFRHYQKQILPKWKKRPIPSADSDDLKVADRTEKRPRRSRALQKLEVNRVSTKSIYVETLRKINKCN